MSTGQRLIFELFNPESHTAFSEAALNTNPFQETEQKLTK